jgi:hypothetical protein
MPSLDARFFYSKAPARCLSAIAARLADIVTYTRIRGTRLRGADLGTDIACAQAYESRKAPRVSSAYLFTKSASGVFCGPRYCSCASCQRDVPRSQNPQRQRSCRRQASTLKFRSSDLQICFRPATLLGTLWPFGAARVAVQVRSSTQNKRRKARTSTRGRRI